MLALALLLLLTSGIALSTVLWVEYGFPGLLHLTYHVMDFCQSLFFKCVEYADIIELVFIWSGVILLLIGFLYALIKGIVGIKKTERAIRRLPLSKRRGSVILIRDEMSISAFTHGLFRPRIYVSTGLLKSLKREELKAVFLHELHHKRHFDPLRFFLIEVIKNSFFYIPAIRNLVGHIRIKKENEADDAAATAVKPLVLAEALLKVASFNKDIALSASISGGVEGSSISERVLRLIEGRKTRFGMPALRTIVASLLMTVFMVLSLAMPMNASYPGSEDCSTERCALHLNKQPGEDCKTHCKNHHQH